MSAPAAEGAAAAASGLEAFAEKRGEVVRLLQSLAATADALGATTLRDRIARQLVDKLEHDRFHLVVVGEFNHGKTTFVNTLLGAPVLPVGVTPTTATIHQIAWAARPEAWAVDTHGQRRAIEFDSVRRFAVGGDAWPASEATVGGLDHLEVGYPAPWLQPRIVLVDTPGVNDLSLQRADITYSYIPQADAVLFLLDAGQILKESERLFLREKLLKASRDKIVFVIAKFDLLSPDEQREVLAYTRAKLADLVANAVVFPVSAEAELAGRHGESGMPELRAHLDRFLAAERGRVLLANAVGEGVVAADRLAKGLDAKRWAVSQRTEDLTRRIATLTDALAGQAATVEQRRAAIREEIASVKTAAHKDLQRYVDDVCRQLPHVIDSAKPDELQTFLPSFLHDSLRRWVEAETQEIVTRLEGLGEKTVAFVEQNAKESARRVADLFATEQQKLPIEIDSIKYDVGVVALMFGGVALMAVNVMAGGLLATAGPALLAMMGRNKLNEEFRARAKEVAPDVVRDAAEKVSPKLDALIEDAAQKLDTWVVSAGADLYREMLEVLQASRMARTAGTAEAAAAAGAIEAEAQSVATARAGLLAVRASLG